MDTMRTAVQLSLVSLLDVGVLLQARMSAEDMALSSSCKDRCALFVLKGLKPRCQCDGLCFRFGDCCRDYSELCRTELEPKKDIKLALEVGIIIGSVFVVVVVLAIGYFLAVRRQQMDRQSLMEFHEEQHIARALRASVNYNESMIPLMQMLPPPDKAGLHTVTEEVEEEAKEEAMESDEDHPSSSVDPHDFAENVAQDHAVSESSPTAVTTAATEDMSHATAEQKDTSPLPPATEASK